MNKIIIEGNKKLKGTVKIGGMKNDAIALLPATILASGEVTITNIPNITDIIDIKDILNYLGAKTEYKDDVMKIDNSAMENKIITSEYSSKLRASYYFMGALLAKYKKATINFPGGCDFGERPIDIHLKGFKALGAKIIEKDNQFTITAEKLKGAPIYLDFPSVGATINIMVAATHAEGTTIISNAAKEPEIANVATMLNSMGANIIGAGTSEIKIKGVKSLKGCFHESIPDRIEAASYMIIAALLGEKVKIENIIPEHTEAILSKLEEMGVPIEIGEDYCIISAPEELKAVNVKTLVYPGLATDLGQPLEAMMTQCKGTSIVHETIYSNRFKNVKEINKLGANIEIKGNKAIVHGKTPLKGTKVKATDLRGGASVVIAGLIAKGTTTITDAEHVLRGYEKLEQKLTKLGANIKVV